MGGLIDVEHVAPCLPGAAITGRTGRHLPATFRVKLGPTTATYRGTLKIEDGGRGDDHRDARARGPDKRGQGGAKAMIVNAIEDPAAAPASTPTPTSRSPAGSPRFGRGGMIKDISNRLLREFAECLQSKLAAAPAPRAPAADGGGEAMTADEAAASAGAADQVDPASPPAPAPAHPPPPAAAPPVKGFSLLVGVLWERIRGVFRRGG